MTPRWRDRLFGVAAFVVFAVLAWLDTDRCIVANHASVFAAIWAGIEFIADVLGVVGGAIASSLEAVVAYLVTAVGWLGTQIANILVSTGAIFAKVWDALKIVWSDVIKPAIQWLDKAITRLQTWLKSTFGPVFKWLRRVRDELNAIYRRFVKPVVDTIEFIRQINRVLLTFHITVLQKLDAYLAELERRVREPILWLYARLTDVENAVNFIVTADGVFQRLTLLRSMKNYAPAWVNGFWHTQIDPQALADAEAARRPLADDDDGSAAASSLSAFYGGQTSDIDADVNSASQLFASTLALTEGIV